LEARSVTPGEKCQKSLLILRESDGDDLNRYTVHSLNVPEG